MPSLPLFSIERDQKLMKDKSSRSDYRSGSYQSSNSSNSKHISKSSSQRTQRKYHADFKVESTRRFSCYDDENGHSQGYRHRADSKIIENDDPRKSENNKPHKELKHRRSLSPWKSEKRFRRSRSPSERKRRRRRRSDRSDRGSSHSRSRSPSPVFHSRRRKDSDEEETDEESQRQATKRRKERRSPSPIPSSSSHHSHSHHPHNVSNPTVSLSSFPSSSLYVNTEKIVARDPKFTYLPIEWWDRTEDCREAKTLHVAKIDSLCSSRESLVLNTTLWKEDPALEQNMFPYETPPGIVHYTLWSKDELTKPQVICFVDQWLNKNFPQVRRWQYDDNLGERSIELFHVHVYVEMLPYSFTPAEGKEYLPPHMTEE